MKESDLERQVVAYCKKVGALTYKFISPSHRGVPDRIVIGSRGVLFLELKAPGKKPTALQLREIYLINNFKSHAIAAWVDDYDQAKNLIDWIID